MVESLPFQGRGVGSLPIRNTNQFLNKNKMKKIMLSLITAMTIVSCNSVTSSSLAKSDSTKISKVDTVKMAVSDSSKTKVDSAKTNKDTTKLKNK